MVLFGFGFPNYNSCLQNWIDCENYTSGISSPFRVFLLITTHTHTHIHKHTHRILTEYGLEDLFNYQRGLYELHFSLLSSSVLSLSSTSLLAVCYRPCTSYLDRHEQCHSPILKGNNDITNGNISSWIVMVHSCHDQTCVIDLTQWLLRSRRHRFIPFLSCFQFVSWRILTLGLIHPPTHSLSFPRFLSLSLTQTRLHTDLYHGFRPQTNTPRNRCMKTSLGSRKPCLR